jgi:hypothetical protein
VQPDTRLGARVGAGPPVRQAAAEWIHAHRARAYACGDGAPVSHRRARRGEGDVMTKGTGSRVRLVLMFAVAFSLTFGGLAEARAVVYEAVSRTFWSGSGLYASKTKVTAGDVNGDGFVDMIQMYQKSAASSSVYVFQSGLTSMARSAAVSCPMEFAKTQIAAGDYTGDGNADLFLLHDIGGNKCSLYVMTSNGATLGAPREIYRSAANAMAFSRARLTAADVNHDGMDEAIVLYESGSGRSKVFVIGKAYAQVQGRVVDAVTGADAAGIYVALYNSSDVFVAGTNTGTDGSYTLSAPVGTGYHATYTATDYMTATYVGINPSSSGATALETVKLVPAGATGAGVASGIISNAFDGAGVSGLTITLRPGMNNTAGTLAGYSATTGGGGAYSFAALPGGIYTGEITGTGYLTSYFTIVSAGGHTIANQNMSVTPVLTGNDIRIVLTWGTTPSDLDSHLTGPISGTTRFHVWYSSKRYPISSGEATIAVLDHDVTTSYGPETITLSSTSGGVYRYSVYNYSGGGLSTPSTVLADSGAQVRVYQGAALIRTFNVPNQGGTLWKVFEISGTTITPFNTMSYHTAGSANIR